MQTIVVLTCIKVTDKNGINHDLMPGTYEIDERNNFQGFHVSDEILKEAIANGHVTEGKKKGV